MAEEEDNGVYGFTMGSTGLGSTTAKYTSAGSEGEGEQRWRRMRSRGEAAEGDRHAQSTSTAALTTGTRPRRILLDHRPDPPSDTRVGGGATETGEMTATLAPQSPGLDDDDHGDDEEDDDEEEDDDDEED